MAAIIDSAPECVSKDPGTEEERVADSADFVMGDPYLGGPDANPDTACAGFMTFGPGSTYETVDGPGVGAEGAYMVLTWIGIAFMVAALLAWMVYENRRLIAYSLGAGRGYDEQDVPQPGITPDVKE